MLALAQLQLELPKHATRSVQPFVSSPGQRGEHFVSDLGCWLVRLVLTDVPLEHCAAPLVEELLARSVYWLLLNDPELAAVMEPDLPEPECTAQAGWFYAGAGVGVRLMALYCENDDEGALIQIEEAPAQNGGLPGQSEEASVQNDEALDKVSEQGDSPLGTSSHQGALAQAIEVFGDVIEGARLKSDVSVQELLASWQALVTHAGVNKVPRAPLVEPVALAAGWRMSCANIETEGSCVMLEGDAGSNALLTYSCKTSRHISRSSGEGEYVNVADTVDDLLAQIALAEDLQVDIHAGSSALRIGIPMIMLLEDLGVHIHKKEMMLDARLQHACSRV